MVVVVVVVIFATLTFSFTELIMETYKVVLTFESVEKLRPMVRPFK